VRACEREEVDACSGQTTTRPFVDGGFEGEGADRALVVPGGVGADIRLHGKVAGSPIENGSGQVRAREALRTLALNQWVDVEQTVGELRIRLGERTRRLSEPANT
jgi:hypothetical protein